MGRHYTVICTDTECYIKRILWLVNPLLEEFYTDSDLGLFNLFSFGNVRDAGNVKFTLFLGGGYFAVLI